MLLTHHERRKNNLWSYPKNTFLYLKSKSVSQCNQASNNLQNDHLGWQ